MTHKVNLDGGVVTVTGNADGRPITLEGKVKNVSLSVERNMDDSEYFGSRFLFVDNERYYLEFDAVDGIAYTMKLGGVPVERTARIEASDRTVEALEKARKQVGAPKTARVRFGRVDATDAALVFAKATPIMVEFYWSEKV